MTERAEAELRSGEALVFDWHRMAICCAAAGDVSLRRATEREIESSRRYRRLGGDAPVYAHGRAYPHLAAREIEIDCHRTLGIRRFTSNLPADFGLRAVFGRLPEDRVAGGAQ